MTAIFPLPKQPVLPSLWIPERRAASPPSLFDQPHLILTHSGRSAIVLALESIGLSAGERVLLPTYHCPTMISPVVTLGGIPTFYPITPVGAPNQDFLESLDTSNTRAMLVPHYFGLPQSLDLVAKFCRVRNLVLIEDCAHCFFGVSGATTVGATGDFAIGSLPKFFPTIEGGLLASAKRIPRTADLPKRPIMDEFRAAWDIIDVSARSGRLGFLGTSVRLATRVRGAMLNDRKHIQCGCTYSPESIRNESLKDPLLKTRAARRVEAYLARRLDHAAIAQRRRTVFRALVSGLAGLRGAAPLVDDCASTSAPYVMPLRVQDPNDAYIRMRAAGLPVFRWDRIWPGTPQLPGDSALEWQSGVIQIACHQSLRDDEIDRICRLARQCVSGN